MYHIHIPGEEIEKWPFWEYEKMTELLADTLKKRKNAEESGGQNPGDYSRNPSQQASQMMRQAQKSVPKMPNVGNFKMPKF